MYLLFFRAIFRFPTQARRRVVWGLQAFQAGQSLQARQRRDPVHPVQLVRRDPVDLVHPVRRDPVHLVHPVRRDPVHLVHPVHRHPVVRRNPVHPHPRSYLVVNDLFTLLATASRSA